MHALSARPSRGAGRGRVPAGVLGWVGVVSLGRNKGFLASHLAPTRARYGTRNASGGDGEGEDSGAGGESVLRAKQGAIEYNAHCSH